MDPVIFTSILVSVLTVLFFMPLWINKAKQIGLVWENMNKVGKPKNLAGSGGIVVIMGFVLGVLVYICIKTFYFKYNFKSNANYDQKAGTDEYIKNLIVNYSNGKRPIKDNLNPPNPEEESLSAIKKGTEQANVEINNVSETKKEELLKLADEKIKSLVIIIQDKEKKLEDMIQRMDAMIQEKAQKIEDKIKRISEESLELLTLNKNSKVEDHIFDSIIVTLPSLFFVKIAPQR